MSARTTGFSTAARLSIAAAALFAVSSFSALSTAFAAAPAPVVADQADTFKPFVGQLNDEVYVRSGPSDVYYATMKLPKGSKVTVTGMKNEWLKIVPPEGSFSYVAKAYVEKTGDGTVCRVSRNDLNVRAGSALNGLKTTVQLTLQQGDELKILGEQDAYYKVAPPAGVFLCVKKGFVDVVPNETPAITPVAPDRQRDVIPSDPVPAGGVQTPADNLSAKPTAGNTAAAIPAAHTATPTQSEITAETAATAGTTVRSSSVAGVGNPATQPVVASTATTQPTGVAAAAPSTQPTETAEAKFDTLEAAFLDTSNQPLDQQPISSLLKKYTALSTDTTLPISMQRITQTRIATLKFRQQANEQYAIAKKLATESKAKQVALKAEQQELSQRAQEQKVTVYAAVGTLRTSSLQQNGAALYRLTDPANGHTLLYVRTNDPKYAGMLNQFVGVQGEIAEDTNLSLRILTPTGVDAVDQAKVNVTVSATVEPPSMLTKDNTASIAGSN